MKHQHETARVVFDPNMPNVNEDTFNTDASWRDFNGNVRKESPAKTPKPLGKPVCIFIVDTNHAGNVNTRRFHTGILIYVVKNAPIVWFLEQQNAVESSSFGNVVVALQIAKEMLVAWRYKLVRM